MKTRRFILVVRNREEVSSPYVSGNVYDSSELQRHMSHLDSLGVDVVDVIPFDVDLSVYEH